MRATVLLGSLVGLVLMLSRAFAGGGAMTAGDLQQLCVSSAAENKAACRFYILGVTQGLQAGMSIATGKVRGGRPCVPENTADPALELAVKIKIGEDLTVFPDDRKLDASGLVSAILVNTFPCQKEH